MKRLGIWLIVFGVLDFLLPRLGYDLRWFELLGSSRDLVAAGLLVSGAALVVLGMRRRPEG
jgi:hypothetical protein